MREHAFSPVELPALAHSLFGNRYRVMHVNMANSFYEREAEWPC